MSTTSPTRPCSPPTTTPLTTTTTITTRTTTRTTRNSKKRKLAPQTAALTAKWNKENRRVEAKTSTDKGKYKKMNWHSSLRLLCTLGFFYTFFCFFFLDLEAVELINLYTWLTGIFIFDLGLSIKLFLSRCKDVANLENCRYWIVNVNPSSTSHWVFVDVDVKKKEMKIYDPMPKLLTASFVRQLRKAVPTYTIQSQRLGWQDNGWECGYFCLWLLIRFSHGDNSLSYRMPPIFREICEWQMANVDQADKVQEFAKEFGRICSSNEKHINIPKKLSEIFEVK